MNLNINTKYDLEVRQNLLKNKLRKQGLELFNPPKVTLYERYLKLQEFADKNWVSSYSNWAGMAVGVGSTLLVVIL